MDAVEMTGEPPISDPVVTIQDRKLTVIYNLFAEFKCSEWGQDPRELMKVLLDFRRSSTSEKMELHQDPRHLYYVFQLFAACVAHNFTGEIAPTAEQWAIRLGDDADLVGALAKALYLALGKRLLARQRRTQPAEIPAASLSALQ